MYAGFFGLRQPPFSIAPDPHCLYMSERHREALAHLLYGVQGGGGFVLLTGEIGAGKTTVCRAFLEQVPDNCRVAYIFNPKLTVGDLLKTICHEFHIEVKHEGIGPATIKDHLDPLNEYLLASHAQGLQNLLIIDEAQALTPYVLEQLRLLTNLETNERKLLQIVLIGQPELRQLLARPDLEQLAQRVIARYHLSALDERETLDYLQHRLAVAGLQGPLPFEPRALRRIHALTRGVPRRINLLCDRALLGAYARGQRQVTTAIVHQAAAEVFDTPTTRVGLSGRDRHAWWLGLGALAALAVAAAVAWTWWPGTVVAPPAAPPLAQPSAPQQPPVPVSTPASEPVQPALAAVATATAPPPPSSPPPANQLYRTEALAWRELAGFWDLTLATGDACEAAQRQQHQCYRTTRMSLHGLQQLDRPAILGLRLPGQPMVMALLTGLSDGHATLQAGGQRWQMPLTALTDIWQGDYATFWKTPPGVAGRISDALRGAAMPWLAQQLSTLQSQGALDTDAGSTLARLAAFQRRHGIDADGVAGPVTCMLINRATGVEEPRLSTLGTPTPPTHVLHP